MNKRTAELCRIYKGYKKEKYQNNSYLQKTIKRSRHNPGVGMMAQRMNAAALG
jgi:hypothetical protein